MRPDKDFRKFRSAFGPYYSVDYDIVFTFDASIKVELVVMGENLGVDEFLYQ